LGADDCEVIVSTEMMILSVVVELPSTIGVERFDSKKFVLEGVANCLLDTGKCFCDGHFEKLGWSKTSN